MAIIELRVPGAVSVTTGAPTGYSHPSFMVGAPPQWDDDSDATYAELETFEHPDVSYSQRAYGNLEKQPVTAPADRVSVFARVRYQSMAVDMAPPMAQVNSSDNAYALLTGSLSGGGASAPTWVDIPLHEVESGRMAQFVNRLNGGSATLELRVRSPFLRKYSYRTPHTRIYEAFVVLITPSDDAPPCRIFPRSDGLGVGAGRNYPPPKSQQRSSRGVGHY